jgi:hypothetical protein
MIQPAGQARFKSRRRPCGVAHDSPMQRATLGGSSCKAGSHSTVCAHHSKSQARLFVDPQILHQHAQKIAGPNIQSWERGLHCAIWTALLRLPGDWASAPKPLRCQGASFPLLHCSMGHHRPAACVVAWPLMASGWRASTAQPLPSTAARAAARVREDARPGSQGKCHAAPTKSPA